MVVTSPEGCHVAAPAHCVNTLGINITDDYLFYMKDNAIAASLLPLISVCWLVSLVGWS